MQFKLFLSIVLWFSFSSVYTVELVSIILGPRCPSTGVLYSRETLVCRTSVKHQLLAAEGLLEPIKGIACFPNGGTSIRNNALIYLIGSSLLVQHPPSVGCKDVEDLFASKSLSRHILPN